MSISVGIPCMKLSPKPSSKSKSSRTGRLGAVVCEALEERYCKDEALDRAKTKNNVYTGIRSGKELIMVMQGEAKEFSQKRQAEGGRALRDTAAIGFATIIKPDADSIMAMTEDERDRFFNDSNEILDKLLGVENIRSRVRHRDEGAEHEHTFRMGFRPDGVLETAFYFKPKLFSKINKEYPELMRQKGWDVKDCDCYDAERAKKDPDYVAERKERRQKNGRSSARYKADKDREALEKREEQLKARERALEAREEAVAQAEVRLSMRQREAAKALQIASDAVEACKGWKERQPIQREIQQQARLMGLELRSPSVGRSTDGISL